MRILRLLPLCMLASVLAFTAGAQNQNQGQQEGGGARQGGGGGRARRTGKPLEMTIPGFADGTDIPVKFTAAGDELTPEINWVNTPEGTVSFVLHMHDMDNLHNNTTDDQVQWLVWNIPGTATGLPEGVPKGAQLQNGASQTSATGPSYRGPGHATNPNKHHYAFELFALDMKVDVQAGSDASVTRESIMKAMQGHILGKATYIGYFRRPPAADK